jgi:hypothetical protein
MCCSGLIADEVAMRRMKLLPVLTVFCCSILLSAQQTRPAVETNVPNFVTVGRPFPIKIYIEPPAKRPVQVEVEDANGDDIEFSEKKVIIKPGQTKRILGTFKNQPPAGITYIDATADGYDDDPNLVMTEFTGHLQPNFQGFVPYDSPATMTMVIVDQNGNPILLNDAAKLHISSTDAVILGAKDDTGLDLEIGPGSKSSPEFQIRPKSIAGGTVHVNAVLKLPDYPMILSGGDFAFSAEPVWWLPLLLAIAGGALHGFYKLFRLPAKNLKGLLSRQSFVILVGSGIAGIIGYLFAHLDLLGLKLDPNVLRTYPLVGFLFSYIGFEALLPQQLRPKRHGNPEDAEDETSTTVDENVAQTGSAS